MAEIKMQLIPVRIGKDGPLRSSKLPPHGIIKIRNTLPGKSKNPANKAFVPKTN